MSGKDRKRCIFRARTVAMSFWSRLTSLVWWLDWEITVQKPSESTRINPHDLPQGRLELFPQHMTFPDANMCLCAAQLCSDGVKI